MILFVSAIGYPRQLYTLLYLYPNILFYYLFLFFSPFVTLNHFHALETDHGMLELAASTFYLFFNLVSRESRNAPNIQMNRQTSGGLS